MSTSAFPPGQAPPFFGGSSTSTSEAKEETDVRIRLANNSYRVIAPAAKRSGPREWVNGTLVLEQKQKNALGETIWVKVGEVPKPRAGDLPEEHAIYSFLAAGAEDA